MTVFAGRGGRTSRVKTPALLAGNIPMETGVGCNWLTTLFTPTADAFATQRGCPSRRLGFPDACACRERRAWCRRYGFRWAQAFDVHQLTDHPERSILCPAALKLADEELVQGAFPAWGDGTFEIQLGHRLLELLAEVDVMHPHAGIGRRIDGRVGLAIDHEDRRIISGEMRDGRGLAHELEHAFGFPVLVGFHRIKIGERGMWREIRHGKPFAERAQKRCQA